MAGKVDLHSGMGYEAVLSRSKKARSLVLNEYRGIDTRLSQICLN
jgi:hypothetical protein